MAGIVGRALARHHGESGRAVRGTGPFRSFGGASGDAAMSGQGPTYDAGSGSVCTGSAKKPRTSSIKRVRANGGSESRNTRP